jgi:hypothetical protein
MLRIVPFFLMALLFFKACDTEDILPPDQEPEPGSWSLYSRINWAHDGAPLSGEYCKVYSDQASPRLKLQCLEFADKMFREILSGFGVAEGMELILPPENDRINVYINVAHPENIAHAYWGTIFITVRTPELDTLLYTYLFKHELTHELEFLVEGKVNLLSEVWFREAIAIYSGGGFQRITSVEDLDQWMLENENFPGQGNPVLIKEWSDFPDGASIDRYCWYAFDLAMRYLLDPAGLGGTCRDVLDLFFELREGIPFETAFLNHFGIELKNFEKEFYERVRDYLEDPGG